MIKRIEDVNVRSSEYEKLLTSMQGVIAIVNNPGESQRRYLLEGTPENIASIIMDNPSSDTKIVDLMDWPVVDTFGCFLNRIYQPDIGDAVKTELVAMQTGAKTPVDVLVATESESEVYRGIHCFYDSPSCATLFAEL